MLLEVLVLVPLYIRVVLAASVPIVGHVPQPDQVLLVEHNRPLVVLLGHAPDAVHRVVVAGELGLAPQRVA